MKTIILFLAFLSLPGLTNAAPVQLPTGEWWSEIPTLSGVLVWTKVLGPISAKASELTLRQTIEQNIKTMADWYGVERDFMLRLATCESNYDVDVLGDRGKSLGLYQWQTRSWAHYNKVYKTKLDRELWTDQVKMTAQVLADGGWRNWWNCSLYIRTGSWGFLKK